MPFKTSKNPEEKAFEYQRRVLKKSPEALKSFEKVQRQKLREQATEKTSAAKHEEDVLAQLNELKVSGESITNREPVDVKELSQVVEKGKTLLSTAVLEGRIKDQKKLDRLITKFDSFEDNLLKHQGK